MPGSLPIHLLSRRRREVLADRRCSADGRSGRVTSCRVPPVSFIASTSSGEMTCISTTSYFISVQMLSMYTRSPIRSFVEVQKIRISVPSAMTRDHRVCIDAADGDACLSQHCRAVCHVLIIRAEVQRQSYFKLRDVDYPECLILQAVLR